MNHYETVFILNPVLSDTQIKETVQKFEDYLVSKGAEIISKEDWGLKKLAYPIQKKKSGFYHLIDYKVAGEEIAAFELEFRRDDSVMRYLSVRLDKHLTGTSLKYQRKVAQAIKRSRHLALMPYVGDLLK
ncbi:MAG: 30S ribosomal protein S6 [Flavobacteriales bacterium]